MICRSVNLTQIGSVIRFPCELNWLLIRENLKWTVLLLPDASLLATSFSWLSQIATIYKTKTRKIRHKLILKTSRFEFTDPTSILDSSHERIKKIPTGCQAKISWFVRAIEFIESGVAFGKTAVNILIQERTHKTTTTSLNYLRPVLKF